MNLALAMPPCLLAGLVSLASWTGNGTLPAGNSGREDPAVSRTPEHISLPRPTTVGKISVEEALRHRRSVREYLDAPLSLAEVGQLLWAAQGINEPVRGLRTAPSAGALYPLEVRLLAGSVLGLSPGLYRYDPATHGLVPEVRGDLRQRLAEAALGQEPIRLAPCVILISGVVARTAVKYGSRAERYVLMEAGHASENVYLEVTSLGLGTVSIGAFHDDRVREVLRLPSEERVLYLMPVGKPVEQHYE
jgi:SagB-type dehydrogenase family enzyme